MQNVFEIPNMIFFGSKFATFDDLYNNMNWYVTESTFFSQGLPNLVALSNFHRKKEDQFVLKLSSRLYQSNGISPNAKFVLSTLKREEQYVLISAIWTLNELHTSFSRIFIFNLNIYIIRFSDIGKSFKLQTDSQSDSDR